MTRRGKILRDTNVGPGLLTVEGKQYVFTLEGMWQSDVPPRIGMTVDAGFDPQGALETVAAVSEGQIARESALKAFDVTAQRSAIVAGGLKGRFGAAAIAAEVVMILSFFALPNFRYGAGYGSKPFTGWDMVSLDPATMLSTVGALSLLAILCLLAPISVPFLTQAWARWLNAAPLVFLVLATVAVSSEIRSATAPMRGVAEELGGMGQQIARQLAPSFSPAVGVYLVILCALYLAVRAFRSRAH